MAGFFTEGVTTSGKDELATAKVWLEREHAAGPTPLRSLSGPAIDLGPAASQAIGSSLLGDERAGRTEALRARMIDNVMRTNGGDRLGAIAQTNRDLDSLREGGWAPGMFMREPGGPIPVQVSQQIPTVDANSLFTTGEAPSASIDSNPSLQFPPELAARATKAVRVKRYIEASPFAAAAEDINKLGDKPGALQPGGDIERLPLDANAINSRLGLKATNALTDNMLRDDKTGFRAALYLNRTNGRYILVARDTQPHSIADWRTNFDNGDGKLTPQYQAMIALTTKLHDAGVKFDLAGYSKGGGLAQVAGLIAKDAKVWVFNSAGIHRNSLDWTKAESFDSLSARLTAVNSSQDFMTHMNKVSERADRAAAEYQSAQKKLKEYQIITSKGIGSVYGIDMNGGEAKLQKEVLEAKGKAYQAAQAEIAAAAYLRDQIAGPYWHPPGVAPMKPQYTNPIHNPERPDAVKDDPTFPEENQALLDGLNAMIEQRKADPYGPSRFPPVRTNNRDTVPNSMSALTPLATFFGAKTLNQHLIENVTGPMKIYTENFDREVSKYKSEN